MKRQIGPVSIVLCTPALDKTLRSSDNSKYRLCEGILTRFPFWKEISTPPGDNAAKTVRFAYIDQDEWKSNNLEGRSKGSNEASEKSQDCQTRLTWKWNDNREEATGEPIRSPKPNHKKIGNACETTPLKQVELGFRSKPFKNSPTFTYKTSLCKIIFHW